MMKKSHSTRHPSRASHLRTRLFGAGSERGIALIMVAIQILVLTALSAFVLDYGMLWLGRRQAQNAADSGALAGSIALAKDDRTWAPLGTNALVTSSAKNTAETNRVLGVT